MTLLVSPFSHQPILSAQTIYRPLSLSQNIDKYTKNSIVVQTSPHSPGPKLLRMRIAICSSFPHPLNLATNQMASYVLRSNLNPCQALAWVIVKVIIYNSLLGSLIRITSFRYYYNPFKLLTSCTELLSTLKTVH